MTLEAFLTPELTQDRRLICINALAWLGTPYVHQQRVRGCQGGVDCAGLVAGTAYDSELVTLADLDKIPPYPATWHWHSDFPMLTEIMKGFGCKKKSLEDLQPGDILAFKIGKCVSHLGIYLGDGWFVHAEGRGPKEVTRTTLNGAWLRRLEEAYAFPGVD